MLFKCVKGMEDKEGPRNCDSLEGIKKAWKLNAPWELGPENTIERKLCDTAKHSLKVLY